MAVVITVWAAGRLPIRHIRHIVGHHLRFLVWFGATTGVATPVFVCLLGLLIGVRWNPIRDRDADDGVAFFKDASLCIDACFRSHVIALSHMQQVRPALDRKPILATHYVSHVPGGCFRSSFEQKSSSFSDRNDALCGPHAGGQDCSIACA
jgi:hypothetical protein